MPAGLVRFPAFSLATRGLLASCWKARTPASLSTTFDAQNSILHYSSIADAMLGRAKKAFEPPASKNDLVNQLFPSSSPAQNGNIEAQFNKARQSSQSIGGFTGLTNTSNTLCAKSPNIKQQGLKRKSDSFVSASTSRLSVFSNANSFQDTPDTLLTLYNQVGSRPNAKSNYPVHFDESDFDDDADLDLDIDYPIPSAMGAPLIPSSQRPRAISQSPYNLPQQSRPLQQPHAPQLPTSSAQTWSSSSPSHMAPPPASLARWQREQQAARDLVLDEEADVAPRPAKRRTLPWAQKKAEEDEIAARNEERAELLASRATSGSSPPKYCYQCKEEGHFVDKCPNRGNGRGAILDEDEIAAWNEGKAKLVGSRADSESSGLPVCFRCKEKGHFVKDCPNRGKRMGTEWDYTPIPKDKSMPWNTTASAVKEQQRKFKDKQKAARKIDETTMEALEDHHNRKKVAIAPITLSEEQQRVLDLVVRQQKSVFFTGSAGTGKSVLMRAIIAELRKKYVKEPDRVAVTASTGLAACNIGGVTLHSYSGIGLGKEDVPALVKKIKRNQKAKNRWLRTKILIIDEISMVDGDLFDKLEGIARAMRNNGRAFGGIQLVITGDFFQLPPVPDYDNKARGAKFAFDATTWPTAIHHTIGLTEVFRQKDPVFANMLNEMRLGKITDDTIRAFRKLSRPIKYEDALDATELFPTRNEVDNSNAFRMRDLHGKSYKYEAMDSGTITDINIRDKLLSNMMAPKSLELKKGAQVMLIKNMDEGLVNGSLGKVIAFMTETNFEIYHRNPDILDEGVPLEELDEEDQKARSSILKSKNAVPNSSREFPLVRFSVADGTSRDLLVQPEEWKVELPNGEIQAQRSQLPLILAWALSIHKAQGQTLERVKIDLKKIFEKGQAYVALSRATSQAGLEVQNFDKAKVMAHPRVAEFYNSLYSVNKALEHPKVAKPKPAATTKAQVYEEDFFMAEMERSRWDGFDEEEAAMAAYG